MVASSSMTPPSADRVAVVEDKVATLTERLDGLIERVDGIDRRQVEFRSETLAEFAACEPKCGATLGRWPEFGSGRVPPPDKATCS
jgi:hypothetical protein